MSNNLQEDKQHIIMENKLTSLIIQPGFVEGIISEPLTFESLEEAYQNIFKNNKEFCIIIWNGMPFKLSYHQDMPFIIRSIADILDTLVNTYNKKWTTHFHSKNIDYDWSFVIEEEDLIITGNFKKITGNHEKAFNSLPIIKMAINNFFRECKLLLEQLIKAYDDSEHQVKNKADVEIINNLKEINTIIQERASRYQYDKRQT